MDNLTDQINQIIVECTSRVTEAIRNASFAEVAALSAGQPTQQASSVPAKWKQTQYPTPMAAERAQQRRASVSTGLTSARVHSFLSKQDGGMGAKALREHFGVDKPEIIKVLKKALEEGVLVKEGNKVATVYFAANLNGVPEPTHVITEPAAVLAAKPAPIDEARELVKKKKKGEATVVVMKRG